MKILGLVLLIYIFSGYCVTTIADEQHKKGALQLVSLEQNLLSVSVENKQSKQKKGKIQYDEKSENIEISEENETALKIKSVEEKLKTTFSNLNASYFDESPIPGIYEILAGNRLIYFSPENEMLIFGEIFSKQGRSLTAEKLARLQSKKVEDLDLSDALIIGAGEKTIIEFTDPDCPYCRKLHKKLSQEKNVRRVIFFSIFEASHPNAKQKAVHIFCSTDKTKAFDAVFNGKIAMMELIDCDKGKRIVESHQQTSTAFGVSGTPTLVLDTSVITGYREAQIAQFLEN